MDYEKSLVVEQAIQDIKEGLNVEENILIIEESVQPIIQNEKDKEYKRKKKINISYGQYEPMKELARAIHALHSGKAHYIASLDDIRMKDKETQDLLHAIEMGDVEEEAFLGLAQDLKEIRQNRRVAKNFSELSKPIHDFAVKHANALDELKGLYANMMKIENSLKTRKYYPRELTAMEVAFQSMQEKSEQEI